MTNAKKRILTAIAALFLCIAVLLSWGVNSATVFAASNAKTQFEKTNVLDDLKS